MEVNAGAKSQIVSRIKVGPLTSKASYRFKCFLGFIKYTSFIEILLYQSTGNKQPFLSEFHTITRYCGLFSAGAVAHIRDWLTEPRYAAYAAQVAEHLAAGKWQELDDVFWTIIPFGTGGRRGRMYPIGSNAINDRTIGESAQGLADYVKEHGEGRWAAVLCDRLRHAAQLAPLRPTVRRNHGRRRVSGLLPRRLSQHARAVVPGALQAVLLRHHGDRQPQSAQRQRGESLLVDRRSDPAAARQGCDRPGDERRPDPAGRLRPGRWPTARFEICKEEVDAAFLAQLTSQAYPGPRQLKIIYSPLHGVGASAVVPALRSRRFPGCRGVCRPRAARRRFPQRAGTRGQSGEPRRL